MFPMALQLAFVQPKIIRSGSHKRQKWQRLVTGHFYCVLTLSKNSLRPNPVRHGICAIVWSQLF
jgi:hypothetical protein